MVDEIRQRTNRKTNKHGRIQQFGFTAGPTNGPLVRFQHPLGHVGMGGKCLISAVVCSARRLGAPDGADSLQANKEPFAAK